MITMKFRRKILLGVLPVLLMISLTGFADGEKITIATLLEEMTDRDRMAYFPEPAYTSHQFSSYNRTSVEPSHYSWFGNIDNNYFLRTEENNGRREFVLFDSEGPGALVRFWITINNYARKGVFRFYFDNETEPRIVGEPLSLISGGELAGFPLSFSVSEDIDYSRRGHNLYLPIPFSKHLKITYETDGIREVRDGIDEKPDPTQEMFYYQINYRKYDHRVHVESFSTDQLMEYKNVIDKTLLKLRTNDRSPEGTNLLTKNFSGSLAPGKDLRVSAKGGKAIRKLQVKLQAEDLPQALRSTVIMLSFDGNRTVWVPAGDFFGTGYQVNAASTWYHEVLPNGTMQVYWIMPFQEEFELKIINLGDQEVKILDGQVTTSDWKWDNNSMYFGSSWYQNTRIDTGLEKGSDGKGDFCDLNYTTLNGQGVLVGDAVTLFNCSPAWWGEGDEKIFVDNESFPSHFGTGTEDYYGYAWCRPERFVHSFIAQPDGSGNLSVGYTINMRYRSLDAIPFRKRLQFDMEMWHWGNTIMNHAPVTYWYLRPGGNCEIKPDLEGAKEPVVLHREQIFSPLIDKNGRVEGEDLVVEDLVGESTARIRFIPVPEEPNWTRAMMAWNNVKKGDRITFRFYCEDPGTYDLTMHTLAGIGDVHLNLLVNERTILSNYRITNISADELKVNLQNILLKKGSNRLILEASDFSGKNNYFGIDRLDFTQK